MGMVDFDQVKVGHVQKGAPIITDGRALVKTIKR